MNPLNKLHKNKRGGVSTVIAMVMAMTVVFSVVTNIFLWEQVLHREEQDRAAERFTIGTIYITSNGTACFPVANTGTVTIRLAGLWINDTRYAIDYLLNPTEQTIIPIPKDLELTAESTFNVVIVTQRGLAATSKYPPTLEVPATGVFKINWFYFKYTSKQNQEKVDAMVIPSNEKYVAIYLKVVNNWIYPANITLETLVTLVVPSIDIPFVRKNVPMFIVESVSYSGFLPTIARYTSEITINPQEERELVFASNSKGGRDWQWQWERQEPIKFIARGIGHLQLTLFYELIKSPTEIEKHGQVLLTQGVYFQ